MEVSQVCQVYSNNYKLVAKIKVTVLVCLDFFPGCCSGSHRCLQNVLILTCISTMWPSRTWSMGWKCSTDPCRKQHHSILTLCPTCAAIHWYVLPAFLQAYNATLFNWLKFNMSTYLSMGHGCAVAWMLQTLFTSQNRWHKDRPPEHHLIANDSNFVTCKIAKNLKTRENCVKHVFK